MPGKKEIAVIKESNDVGFNQQAEALISQAIDKKVPVETMEKLLSMRRELKKEWAEEQFNTAMAEFQNECPIIDKGKAVMNSNSQTARYKYAPLEEIVRQAGPVIAKHGFSYIIKAKVAENVVKANVKVTHKYGHSDESEFEVPIDPKAFMNEQQKFASALTYAKRYAFCNAFGIMTGDEDDDSNANTEDKPKQQAAPVKPKPLVSSSTTTKPIEPKERIMIELKKLGNEPKNKPEVEELVKGLTTLDLKPENFEEIISRLSALVQEVAQSSGKRPNSSAAIKDSEEVVEGVVVAPTPVKKEISGEKISTAKLTVVRALAKTNCFLLNDAEIKEFFQITTERLEDLSVEEGETLFKKLTTSR